MQNFTLFSQTFLNAVDLNNETIVLVVGTLCSQPEVRWRTYTWRRIKSNGKEKALALDVTYESRESGPKLCIMWWMMDEWQGELGWDGMRNVAGGKIQKFKNASEQWSEACRGEREGDDRKKGAIKSDERRRAVGTGSFWRMNASLYNPVEAVRSIASSLFSSSPLLSSPDPRADWVREGESERKSGNWLRTLQAFPSSSSRDWRRRAAPNGLSILFDFRRFLIRPYRREDLL